RDVGFYLYLADGNYVARYGFRGNVQLYRRDLRDLVVQEDIDRIVAPCCKGEGAGRKVHETVVIPHGYRWTCRCQFFARSHRTYRLGAERLGNDPVTPTRLQARERLVVAVGRKCALLDEFIVPVYDYLVCGVRDQCGGLGYRGCPGTGTGYRITAGSGHGGTAFRCYGDDPYIQVMPAVEHDCRARISPVHRPVHRGR